MVKEIDMKVQEAQRIPIMTDAKRPSPRHIIKWPKVKDRLLKVREVSFQKDARWEKRRGRIGEDVRGLRSTSG